MYRKEFAYKAQDGIEQKIIIKPVSPVFFKELFRVSKALSQSKDDAIEGLTDDVVQDLINICMHTMDKSCPDWSKDDKEEFVTMNFNPLIAAILELNTPKA